MKFIFCLLLSFCGCYAHAKSSFHHAGTFYFQDTTVDPKDVSSADAIVKALYNVISGAAGEKRNWARFRGLFSSDGRLIATNQLAGGQFVKRTMTVEEYIAAVSETMEQSGFFEKELGRKTETFGKIAHCFSAYEGKRPAGRNPEVIIRGVNSIQLYNDGRRWWILSVYWQAETKDVKLPPEIIGRW